MFKFFLEVNILRYMDLMYKLFKKFVSLNNIFLDIFMERVYNNIRGNVKDDIVCKIQNIGQGREFRIFLQDINVNVQLKKMIFI